MAIVKPKSDDLVKIIQITDTHIIDDGAPLFNEFDTSVSLQRILEKIRIDEPDADLVLLTGDLVHEATKSSYQKLADHLSSLPLPVFCLPGNHDDPVLMDEVLVVNGNDVSKTITAGQWFIVLLNTCLEGEHSGELTASELEFLRETLNASLEQHCLIALHHHPVSINSPWMDSMILKNAQNFLSIVDDFHHVRGIIWGHIHQEFELHRNNLTLLGSPSTCIQFKPECDAFAVDEKPPAYRKILLHEDGVINTEVVYVDIN